MKIDQTFLNLHTKGMIRTWTLEKKLFCYYGVVWRIGL